MCGIAGLCLKGRAVQEGDILAMSGTLAHRGPDGQGHFVDRNVGIGVRRLAVIDPSGGDQPIANETSEVQVVQNGEIYNYRELRHKLESRGHTFRTDCDTEVIVHAFEEWGGRDFSTRLRGMFAIAVWDNRHRALWLSRDRLGIKPLYFIKSPKGFAFGSELKALLACSWVEAELDPAALSDYLTFGSADVDRSFYRGVRQLLPGCVLRISAETGDVQNHRYWEFQFAGKRIDFSESDAQEALEEKLREAIRHHLVSDVPIGAFLSGGVDSSTVVGIAVEEGASDLSSFSIGFEDEDSNELPHARTVARHWGLAHFDKVISPDAVQVIDQVASHLDEPFADASAIPTWYVSQLAAEQLKVVLTGDGGDELFAGYDRYVTATRRRFLDRIPHVLRSFGARIARALPDTSPGKNYLYYASLDAAGRYAAEHCLFPVLLQEQILLPDFSPQRVGRRHPLERSSQLLRSFGAVDYLSNCMQYDITRYLPMDILVKVDRMTMAHGVEARPPLLDHELVELAASLPTSLKYRSPKSRKVLLRKIAQGVVPAEVLERRKKGFSLPLQRWFASPLRPMFEDMVLNSGVSSQYLDRTVMKRIFEENRTGRRDRGLQLWAILMLEIWLRRL